jgi:hypothetical protein
LKRPWPARWALGLIGVIIAAPLSRERATDNCAGIRGYRAELVIVIDATHAEVFDFEKFLDAVFRAPVIRQIRPMSRLQK